MSSNTFFPNRVNQSLCGAWKFRQANTSIWHNAQVPGCNFTDLLENGLIEDPFYRDNETKLQWIEQNDWVYKTTFCVDEAMTQFEEIALIAEGLDTFCDVYLNGHLLGVSENMFVQHRFLCKEHLVKEENTLELYFHSPIKTARPYFEQAGYAYPAENDKSEDKLSVYCRKAPCHFGWDWGPRFVTSGIYLPIYLQGVTPVSITDVHVSQVSLTDEKAVIDIISTLEGEDAQFASLQVKINDEVVVTNSETEVQNDTVVMTQRLVIDSPKRWWPNGLGDAYLYALSVSVSNSTDTFETRFGLRTVEVVNENDEQGQSFYLKVNGHPVFMKGANYIPSDSFIHRVDDTRLEQEFASVVAANMNMLRVWGGGVYQTKRFYELADENGVLIWQDFMFACTLYPGDEAFLNNVKEEATQQVKRLRNHPCIALWCGNNEVDMAIKHWDWADKFGYSEDVFTKLKNDYIALFDVLLRNVVNTLDSDRYYVRSSPISFWEEDADHIANHHYWGVWHGEEPFSEYQKRVPRFMTEYGFQSFPLQNSIERFTLPEDQCLSSPVMTVHQKHPRGNGLIAAYMNNVYPTGSSFEHLVYLSQVQQAEGLKLAFDAHRRAKPYCMGTLYWQLNDTWPAASWSGIDYYGKWKALHYQAKRSFAPISLTIEELEPEQFSIYLLNDTLATQQGECAISVNTLDGAMLYTSTTQVVAPANENAPIIDKALNHQLTTIQRDNAYIEAVFTSEDGLTVVRNHFFLAAPVAQKLAQPQIDISVNIQGQCLEVALTAKAVVRQLYVEVRESTIQFDDNFVDLLPGETKIFTASLDEDVASEAHNLREALSLLSLNDCMEALCN